MLSMSGLRGTWAGSSGCYGSAAHLRVGCCCPRGWPAEIGDVGVHLPAGADTRGYETWEQTEAGQYVLRKGAGRGRGTLRAHLIDGEGSRGRGARCRRLDQLKDLVSCPDRLAQNGTGSVLGI